METTTTPVHLVPLLDEQLSWHVEGHVLPRLAGLTDDEYHWQPVAGSWGVRRKRDPGEPGGGDWTCDIVVPEPEPAPITTIAWRLAHVTVGIFAERSGSHLDARFPWGTGYGDWQYAGTAAEGLEQLRATYEAWRDGVRALTAADLERQVGQAEGPWAEHSMAELVVHVNREAIHHLAEVCLLRDLYGHGLR